MIYRQLFGKSAHTHKRQYRETEGKQSVIYILICGQEQEPSACPTGLSPDLAWWLPKAILSWHILKHSSCEFSTGKETIAAAHWVDASGLLTGSAVLKTPLMFQSNGVSTSECQERLVVQRIRQGDWQHIGEFEVPCACMKPLRYTTYNTFDLCPERAVSNCYGLLIRAPNFQIGQFSLET